MGKEKELKGLLQEAIDMINDLTDWADGYYYDKEYQQKVRDLLERAEQKGIEI